MKLETLKAKLIVGQDDKKKPYYEARIKLTKEQFDLFRSQQTKADLTIEVRLQDS